MAILERKLSSTRQNKRRSNVWGLNVLVLVRCSKCDEYKLTHRVCGSCGYYDGRDILKEET